VGDPISIGGTCVRIISSFASIVLDRPCTHSFDKGAQVVQLPSKYKHLATTLPPSDVAPSVSQFKMTGQVSPGQQPPLGPTSPPIDSSASSQAFGNNGPGRVFIGILVACVSCGLLSLCVGVCIYCLGPTRQKRSAVYPGHFAGDPYSADPYVSPYGEDPYAAGHMMNTMENFYQPDSAPTVQNMGYMMNPWGQGYEPVATSSQGYIM
jgi:hypothetical protein